MIMVPMNPRKVKNLRDIMMDNVQKMMEAESSLSVFIDSRILHVEPGNLVRSYQSGIRLWACVDAVGVRISRWCELVRWQISIGSLAKGCRGCCSCNIQLVGFEWTM